MAPSTVACTGIRVGTGGQLQGPCGHLDKSDGGLGRGVDGCILEMKSTGLKEELNGKGLRGRERHTQFPGLWHEEWGPPENRHGAEGAGGAV